MKTIRGSGFLVACQLLFQHFFFPSLQVEFELSKLLPFSNNAVNTLQSLLSHLPMVNITSVTASDMCRGSAL